MFKRLLFDTWEGFLPAAGFVLTALAFLIILIRALRMRKPEVARLAALPLDDHSQNETSPSGHVPR